MAITLLVVMSVDGHPPPESDTDMNQGNRGWQRHYGYKMHEHDHGHDHEHEHGHGCGHGEGGGLISWVKGKLGIGKTTPRPLTTPTTMKMPTSVTTSTTTTTPVAVDSGDQQPDVVEDGNGQRQDSDGPSQDGDRPSQDGDRPSQDGDRPSQDSDRPSQDDGNFDISPVVDTSSEKVDSVGNVPTNGNESDAMLLDEAATDPSLDVRSPL